MSSCLAGGCLFASPFDVHACPRPRMVQSTEGTHQLVLGHHRVAFGSFGACVTDQFLDVGEVHPSRAQRRRPRVAEPVRIEERHACVLARQLPRLVDARLRESAEGLLLDEQSKRRMPRSVSGFQCGLPPLPGMFTATIGGCWSSQMSFGCNRITWEWRMPVSEITSTRASVFQPRSLRETRSRSASSTRRTCSSGTACAPGFGSAGRSTVATGLYARLPSSSLYSFDSAERRWRIVLAATLLACHSRTCCSMSRSSMLSRRRCPNAGSHTLISCRRSGGCRSRPCIRARYAGTSAASVPRTGLRLSRRSSLRVLLPPLHRAEGSASREPLLLRSRSGLAVAYARNCAVGTVDQFVDAGGDD